jgi:hypothetical protein
VFGALDLNDVLGGSLLDMHGLIIGPVPAGLALVGYSVDLTPDVGATQSLTCRFEDAYGSDYAPITLQISPGVTTTFATSALVSLPADSPLRFNCTKTNLDFSALSYTSLSEYAISFAQP